MRRVGIEIEVESLAHHMARVARTLQDSSWSVERETSLRTGGWEVKTSGSGLLLDAALRSMSELYPVFSNSSGTWRAAVHVHVDASDLTWDQRALALCIAYVLDASVFRAVSPERVESNFCAPLETKTELVGRSVRAMLGLTGTRDPDWIQYGKYSSVNSNSLFRFGTFEFRHMQTPETGSDVDSVTTGLDRIKRFVKIAHDIIDNPAVRMLGRLLEDGAFVRMFIAALSGYPKQYGEQILEVDPAAVLDVLTWIDEEFNTVPVGSVDRVSLARCVDSSYRSVFSSDRIVRLRELQDELLSSGSVSDSIREQGDTVWAFLDSGEGE